MIAFICAIVSGMTIVLSRSINGFLSEKIGVYQSTFFNYFTGLIMSILLLLFMRVPYFQDFHLLLLTSNPIMFLGGMIGVFNILILNIVVNKVSPVLLTLMIFCTQLVSGIVLDYCFYEMFSMQKLIGCCLVIIGLIIYQYSSINKQDI